MTLRSVLPIAAITSLTTLFPLQATPPSSTRPALRLTEQDARPTSLIVGGTELVHGTTGGFHIYDAATKKNLTLPKGTVREESGVVTFTTESDDLRLSAKFTSHKTHIEVTGEIETLNDLDRGLLLDYRVPLTGDNVIFTSDLGEPTPITKGSKPIESNVFPIGALANSQTGVALAIPPDAPRIFGLVADETGLAIRFYLGVTPKTTRFPRRAAFTFHIYTVDPSWGFRSALAQYYRLYPDYYTPRLKKDGLYMFQMGDRTPENIDQYGYNLFETQLPSFHRAIERDQKHEITTFPYMIVGQREIKYLRSLPETYDQALGILEKWTPANHAAIALCKENACTEGDIHLKDHVAHSAIHNGQNRYSIVIRHTLWGANSVTFRMNPSPYLFEGTGRHTVGGDALALTERWLKETPEYGGMFIDSLGANWPAILNYREDHFAYARYPLTVDPDGRVAIDNLLSHYEYIHALREKIRPGGRLLNGNGVYAFKSKKPVVGELERQSIDGRKSEFVARAAPTQFFRPGVKLSRFFLAALLDVASCEFGVRASVEQSRDVRVHMGPKQFSFLNYHWTDAEKVEEFVNKSLAFGIFASTTTNFFNGEIYETHPNGYLRDKPLLDWYVPLVRTLSRAGWEPVRGATVEGADISSERFGNGSKIYLTLYNDSTEQRKATVRPDLALLGLTPGQFTVAEIARDTPVRTTGEGRFSIELAPKRSYVLELSTSIRK